MVQSYQSPVRVYKWPFEIVMAAYEKRFPTCPQIPIFVGCEITKDERSADGAVEVIGRKCQLNIDVPYLMKKVMGVDFIYFMQENSLNRRDRTLNIDARNISFSSRVIINEKCNYYVHPDNQGWTCFEQSATLDVKSFFGFESTVEKIAVKQYIANIEKGKEILEFFIKDVLASGVTYIPPFEDSIQPQSSSSCPSPTDSAIEINCKNNLSSSSEGEYEDAAETLAAGGGFYQHHRTGTIIRKQQKSNGTTNNNNNTDDPSQPSQAGGADVKLEADYIQRFLGELTPVEESRLCELKYSLQNRHKGKLPNDAHLLRFLRAREFDVGAAKEMILKSIMWRKTHAVDKILSTYQCPPVINQFFPGTWHKCDKEGRPLFVLRLGHLDIKGLLRSVGEEGLVKFTLSVLEEGLKRTAEATGEVGKPIASWTLLVDLDGLSMRHLWRPAVRCLLKIIEIAEANYPETMGLALIVQAPRVFPVLWTLIGPFINENTKNKFMIHGVSSSSQTLTALKEYIDLKNIPEFLGGPSYVKASEGGHIPKSSYLPVAETAGTSETHGDPTAPSPRCGVLGSLYTTGYIYKGIPIEVLIPVTSKGCVLTWDFDVTKGCCEFMLLRTHKLIEPASLPHTSPPLGALSPGALVAAIEKGVFHQDGVAFDKNMKFGRDLFFEEKPLKCREGDSVQGSHFCNQSGTYVLQWRLLETIPGGAHHGSFEFTLPGKSKIVYYHETIDSVDFKGSMASLESCRSSFSSLSMYGTKQGGAVGVGGGSLSGSNTPSTSKDK